MVFRIQRVAALCSSFADRRWPFFVTAFSLMFFWTAFVRANVKPFWHDEIYTIAIAGLPSVRAIWAAERAGVDLTPPFNSILTHAVFAVAGAGRISTRLPAMMGFWVMTLASFAIVRQRSNTVAGLIAMLLPSLTGAAGYAYEARGYGVMLGLSALALFSWSEAAGGRRRGLYLPLLAFTLAAGVWTHYYAAFAIVPILAGEVIRLAQTRKPDWGVLTSLAGVGVAILPLYSIAAGAAAQSATYWRHASLVDVWDTYVSIAGGLFSPWALAIILCLGAIALACFSRDSLNRRESPGIPAHELVAAFATLLIPLWAVLAGVLITGVFVPRYAVSAVVGFAVLIPLVTWRVGPKDGLVDVLLFLSVVAGFFYVARDARPGPSLAFRSPIESRPLLMSELSSSHPVVVTGILYLQMWYYVPPESRRWLFYVADPAAALKFAGSDTLDRGYLALRDWYPVDVQDYRTFVEAHPRFWVYAVESLTWLPTKLREDRVEVRELGRESWTTLYDVTVR
jgi:hypothetical protein